jgi:hypothetical protein
MWPVAEGRMRSQQSWVGWRSGANLLRRCRLEFVAELGTSFDGAWCVLAVCGRNFKYRAFRAWSRGARPPSGAVGCASRPTCRKFHRPAAAFFSTQPAGARAGAPEPSGVENAELHGRAAGALPGTSALPRHFLRRSRLDSCSGTRNEFRRRLARPHSLRTKFFQNSATGERWSGAGLPRAIRFGPALRWVCGVCPRAARSGSDPPSQRWRAPSLEPVLCGA